MSNVSEIVRSILQDVQKRGDRALCDLSKRFDKITLRAGDLKVTPAEFTKAKSRVSASFLKSIQECAKNVEAFARLEKARLTKSWMTSQGSIRLGQLINAVDSVDRKSTRLNSSHLGISY